MTDLFILVPAPVLGPASWRPVADELTARGARVAVPSLASFARGQPPYAPRLVRLCAEQVGAALADGPAADRVVLVVHSGAGPFAAQLAAAVPAGRAEVAVIFADAGLPAADGPTPVVDGGFLPYLRELARDGVVPPWPQWFPDADPAELYPSETARAADPGHGRGEQLGDTGQPDGWAHAGCRSLSGGHPCTVSPRTDGRRRAGPGWRDGQLSW